MTPDLGQEANPTTIWHLYLIECADGSLYTAITIDVDRRFHEHLPAMVAATPDDPSAFDRHQRARAEQVLAYLLPLSAGTKLVESPSLIGMRAIKLMIVHET